MCSDVKSLALNFEAQVLVNNIGQISCVEIVWGNGTQHTMVGGVA